MPESEVFQSDIVIIGAGVVGCAVAQLLQSKNPGQEIIVLESGPRIAEGVTSRNSGVIHAGLYYDPRALKARACIRGAELLYDWALTKNVAHKNLGKLIVASGDREKELLEKLLVNARESGAKRLKRISKNEIQSLEPLVNGEEGILSEGTGIIDPFELTRSFRNDAEEKGTTFIFNAAVESIELSSAGSHLIHTARGQIKTGVIVNAAGLAADEIANLAGIDKYTIYPWRGNYFVLKSAARFNHLVYPVKDPQSSGLGVHLTIDISGQYKLGPDVEYVLSKNDFSPGRGESKISDFMLAARNLFKIESDFELKYDYCGIRPKLRGPNDKAEKDFVVSQDYKGFISLVGIESPGLTASMALAEEVLKLI